MKLKKRKQRVDKGAPKWMVTFSDLMTLILVFFVLLFSMSQIDNIKFQAVAESFKNRVIFDFYPSLVPMENPTEKSTNIKNREDVSEFKTPSENNKVQNETGDPSEAEQNSLNELVDEVQDYLNREGLNEVITANRTDRGVVLILQEKVLFESGRATIIEEGKPFLDKVGKLLVNIPNHVKVEGHTDNRPISTYRYPSNWELSGARASSVIRYINETTDVDPTRFSGVLYAATRPVAPNDSSLNWQKNRRVEIVILDPSYTGKVNGK